MHVGLVYDLRDDYLKLGFSEEETAEFDSVVTIDALDDAITAAGCRVTRIGRGQELARRFVAGEGFDLIFSIGEGLKGRSREAQVPALCELFDQPYVFSDPLTMAVTLDKPVAKRIVRDAGIPTAKFWLFHPGETPDTSTVTFPAFVKPAAEGTGKGCEHASKVEDAAALHREIIRVTTHFHQAALVESYLPGREFTVGILGEGATARIIAVLEIAVRPDADGGIYSYEIKEDWEPYVTLTIATDSEAKAAGDTALAAYRALGCRDASRVDIRSDGKNLPHFLEVNPIAGLHPTHSDLPILWTKLGRDYHDLIAQILDGACARYGLAR